MQPHDDHALLVRWRSGDASAGEELTRRHYDAILRFFEARLTYAAEDLTQRTFLACVEGLERVEPRVSVRGYLFGIARKQMLMHLRHSDRLQRRQFFAAQTTSGSKRTSLSRLFARCEQQHHVLRALVMLPPEFQIVLQLYYWDELRTAEIAEIVETPASTVTSRLARARELLRRNLAAMKSASAMAVLEDLPGWTRSLANDHRPGSA